MIEHLRRLSPGILLCIAITVVAILLQTVEVHFAGQAYLEALVLAILLGVAIRTAWTPAPRYAWIARCIVVCTGEREPAGVNLEFYRML